jgi:phage head maturation protease
MNFFYGEKMKLLDKLFTKGMIGTIGGEEKLFIASDDVEDRQGECIAQDGWSLENFKANPVIQWAHSSQEPAIAVADKIGFKEIDGKKKLVYSPVFHRKTPMSNYIADLVEAGVIKASSVGFKPLAWDPETCTYTKSELLEISFVNVPANQNALSLGMSKGYSMDVIKSVMPDIKIEEKVMGTEILKPEEKPAEENIETDETTEEVTTKTEEKGAIAEELSKEEMAEKKYEKMSNFWNIVYAFCDVYFKEETTPDQFESLLVETAGLLKGLAEGITDEAKAATIDRKDLVKFLEVKEIEENKETEEEKSITERVENMESVVEGLSIGFKTMDTEISEKITSIEDSIKVQSDVIMNDIKTYLSSLSKAQKSNEGVSQGRDPKLASKTDTGRLALKAISQATEVLYKTMKNK